MGHFPSRHPSTAGPGFEKRGQVALQLRKMFGRWAEAHGGTPKRALRTRGDLPIRGLQRRIQPLIHLVPPRMEAGFRQGRLDRIHFPESQLGKLPEPTRARRCRLALAAPLHTPILAIRLDYSLSRLATLPGPCGCGALFQLTTLRSHCRA